MKEISGGGVGGGCNNITQRSQRNRYSSQDDDAMGDYADDDDGGEEGLHGEDLSTLSTGDSHQTEFTTTATATTRLVGSILRHPNEHFCPNLRI